MENEGRHRNSLDYVGGCGTRVVVGCAIESTIERGYFIVKIAQAFQAIQAREVILARKALLFLSHAGFQLPQEILLVETIRREMQSVSGGGQIYGGADSSNSLKTVDDEDRERRLFFGLPITLAENGNPWLNLDQALFGGGQRKPAPKKEARDGLNMAAGKKPAGAKRGGFAGSPIRRCEHCKNC